MSQKKATTKPTAANLITPHLIPLVVCEGQRETAHRLHVAVVHLLIHHRDDTDQLAPRVEDPRSRISEVAVQVVQRDRDVVAHQMTADVTLAIHVTQSTRVA